MAERKSGRPSTYKPEYCQEIIDVMARGHSMAGFAGHIGKSRRVVYEWLEKYPDFAEAHEIAKAKAIYYWEKEGVRFAGDGKGNATMIVFALSNRAPDEWKQRVQHEHAGKDGASIAHSVEVTFVEAGEK